MSRRYPGFDRPHLHQRQQALAAGENFHVVFVRGQIFYRVAE